MPTWFRASGRDKIAHDADSDAGVRRPRLRLRIALHAWACPVDLADWWEWLDSFASGDIDGGYGAVWSPPSGPGLIPFPAETKDGIPALRQLSQEFVWNTRPGSAWTGGWVSSISTRNSTCFGLNYDTLAGNVVNGRIRHEQRTEAWAVFAAATLSVTDTLEVAAGVRVL